jgi:hypothetical protein
MEGYPNEALEKTKRKKKEINEKREDQVPGLERVEPSKGREKRSSLDSSGNLTRVL